MRIIFMGTPDFAVPSLRAIRRGGPRGRGRLHPAAARKPGGAWPCANPPCSRRPSERVSTVRTPARLKSAEEQERFARARRRCRGRRGLWASSCPKPILDGTRHGAFNLHASLLPRWRGAAPINRAIMAGDRETGVSIMRLDEGLDTGPVCLEARVAIGRDMTAGELHDALAASGAALMVHGARRRLSAASSTAGRKPRAASPTPRRSTRARRASTGRVRRPRCTT